MKNTTVQFFKKYHKWLGIILSFFILIFSVSGIFLNHRKMFSSLDISRAWMPDEYHYKNWNNAAVKAAETWQGDSVLIYGNMGIWLTNSDFSSFSDFNFGLPEGIDNRKIETVFSSSKGLFAGTLFGLYLFDNQVDKWVKIPIPTHEKRVVDLLEKDSTLYVLTRSHLLKTNDAVNFSVQKLPPNKGYNNKIGLFKTLWVIHSGEIYGTIGKLLVDLVALIFIFLTITGIIYFIAPSVVKKRIVKSKNTKPLKKINRWSLKWHNKIGYWTVLILIITTATGMFLRPPLLIPIATVQVGKIPFTELDTPNPWFDKLRRMLYDSEKQQFLLATNEGLYAVNEDFTKVVRYTNPPPLSVMGVNVFQKKSVDNYLIGSFNGLFLWNAKTGYAENYITKKEAVVIKNAPPISEFSVTAYIQNRAGEEYYFDYTNGATPIQHRNKFSSIPLKISEIPMSFWNLALEFHTGRFFRFLIGAFYILIVPLVGLTIIFIQISGFIVWWKLHRKKNKKTL